MDSKDSHRSLGTFAVVVVVVVVVDMSSFWIVGDPSIFKERIGT
jgi:Na+/proline symporter